MTPTVLSRRRGLRALGAALLAAALLVGVAACSIVGGSSSVPTSTAKPPSGTEGAVNFDKGYLQAGTGDKRVDVWVDPMCPFCGQFEKTNGATIASAVSDGSITLRIHPLTFLDPNSNGTGYSTRAVAALTCVGVNDPDRMVEYFQALFKDQPEEGSSGLTDEELAKRATDLGIADIAGCLAKSGPYQAWAQRNTARALSGPVDVEGSTLKKIEQTPTVLVNGKQFSGDITKANEFKTFLAAH
ncbi:DsbA family protein [Leifsonia poae]|uniref:DsbA family protein n=1 Tax=Leifsonia poae TaxID=110933 RepID=UPI001CBEF11C|nr:thioredoxin domain-containing protein [Leifsonia poae]